MQNQTNNKHRFHTAALILVTGVAVAASLFLTPSYAACAQEIAECGQCAPGRQGLTALMNGDPDGAIKIFQQIETTDPDSPLGYLLDADANWWKIYHQFASASRR